MPNRDDEIRRELRGLNHAIDVINEEIDNLESELTEYRED